MANVKESSGKCVCGAVSFTAASVSAEVGACHCGTCRRWSGGPFMGVNCGSDVAFEGEGDIKVLDSSDWADRGFCGKCGTHLFYRIKRNNTHVMPVGLFGDGEGFAFTHEVFIDEKPGFYEFGGERKRMTGEECFAKFAEGD